MEKKKDSVGRLEKFFAGKGFYIVLILCVAVIGASSMVLINGGEEQTDVDIPADIAVIANNDAAEPVQQEPVQELQPDQVTEAPAAAPADEPSVTEEDPAQPTDEQTVASDFYIWPVAGEIEIPYSVDALVYNRTMADWRTHAGVDISAEIGTQVMAAGSGRVESIYTDDLYGTTVVIDHYGGLKSVYCNLAETPTVYVGDNISAGDVIGAVGDTALCETGEVAHLHFAMLLDGQSIDPTQYLPAR